MGRVAAHIFRDVLADVDDVIIPQKSFVSIHSLSSMFLTNTVKLAAMSFSPFAVISSTFQPRRRQCLGLVTRLLILQNE